MKKKQKLKTKQKPVEIEREKRFTSCQFPDTAVGKTVCDSMRRLPFATFTSESWTRIVARTHNRPFPTVPRYDWTWKSTVLN